MRLAFCDNNNFGPFTACFYITQVAGAKVDCTGKGSLPEQGHSGGA